MFKKVSLAIVLIVLVMLLWAGPALAAPAAQEGPPVWGPVWEVVQPIAVRGGWLALVIVLDLILGVVVALKQKRFEWQRLADFLGDYGPKIIGWLALEALGFLPAEYQALGGIGGALAVGAYGLIFLSAAASVLGHVQVIGVLPNMSRAGLPPTPSMDVVIVGQVEETDEGPY